MLFVVCYGLLCAVCSFVLVDCCVLCAVWCLLTACCLLFVHDVRSLWCVVFCLLCAVCCLQFVRLLLFVARCLSCVLFAGVCLLCAVCCLWHVVDYLLCAGRVLLCVV